MQLGWNNHRSTRKTQVGSHRVEQTQFLSVNCGIRKLSKSEHRQSPTVSDFHHYIVRLCKKVVFAWLATNVQQDTFTLHLWSRNIWAAYGSLTAWCNEIGSLMSLMHATQVHPVTTENQFHCTRLYGDLVCNMWGFFNICRGKKILQKAQHMGLFFFSNMGPFSNTWGYFETYRSLLKHILRWFGTVLGRTKCANFFVKTYCLWHKQLENEIILGGHRAPFFRKWVRTLLFSTFLSMEWMGKRWLACL